MRRLPLFLVIEPGTIKQFDMAELLTLASHPDILFATQVEVVSSVVPEKHTSGLLVNIGAPTPFWGFLIIILV